MLQAGEDFNYFKFDTKMIYLVIFPKVHIEVFTGDFWVLKIRDNFGLH